MNSAYLEMCRTDVERAVDEAREASALDRASRAGLERLQQQRLDALVRHAVARSPLYRERLGGLVGAGPVDLQTLPTLDKATLVARFEDSVCDPRLRHDDLLEHLDGLDHDALYLDAFRVLATSGSSGRKGLFVYDRAGWTTYISQFLRFVAATGHPPWRDRGIRIAGVIGGSPTHASARVSAPVVAAGLYELFPLPVTLPMPRIVEALNGFRPEVLHAYGSMAALLAEEQIAGRLRVAPRIVSSSSELLTAEMAARVEAAFGTRPYDFYATTEGLWGAPCAAREGAHLFEDLVIVENVDADDRPAAPGEPGARLLITNLFNLVQPLIRYELPDVVALHPEPCGCGSPLRRLLSIEGRADDVVRLPGRDGADVAVHPIQFGLVTADRAVREFQVVQRGERLRLRVVLDDDARVGAAQDRLRAVLAARLAGLGVADPQIDVEPVARLERPPGGKLPMVVAERAAVAVG